MTAEFPIITYSICSKMLLKFNPTPRARELHSLRSLAISLSMLKHIRYFSKGMLISHTLSPRVTPGIYMYNHVQFAH